MGATRRYSVPAPAPTPVQASFPLHLRTQQVSTVTVLASRDVSIAVALALYTVHCAKRPPPACGGIARPGSTRVLKSIYRRTHTHSHA